MEKKYGILLYELKWNSFVLSNRDVSLCNYQNEFFCTVLPPPNITGTLHIGHAFQSSLMDFLVRYNRIIGKIVFWQGGIDHAGIATQVLLERNILNVGLGKCNYTRSCFVNLIWYWKHYSYNIITSQMKSLTTYIDWELSRFTMDKLYTKAVKTAFVRFYNIGVVYRGETLVNWDVALKTAISDLEVVMVECVKSLFFLKYKVLGMFCSIPVATTRPVTIFVDSAVCINPDDMRYNSLVGRYVQIPLKNTIIPIICDVRVLLFFGSGCVKITPAHDFNDYKISLTHFLSKICLYNELTFIVNIRCFNYYDGVYIYDLEKIVLNDLYCNGDIFRTLGYRTYAAIGDRSGSVVEPVMLKQWFVATTLIREKAYTVVQNKNIVFYPERYKKIYYQWLNNLEDWCISRQVWWGHRIPCWYDTSSNKYVGYCEKDVRDLYKITKFILLKRDSDVLDTWFSSALWPFACLGWPDDSIYYNNYYPINVLVTGYDILFFWVARMVMFSLCLTNKVPFKVVYIHGLIKDQHGVKMSKSKGNTIDPVDIVNGITLSGLLTKRLYGLTDLTSRHSIDAVTREHFPKGIAAYGADALRLSLCAAAVPGINIFFSVEKVEIYRNFCTKLWNIGRYLLLQLKECDFFFTTFNTSDIYIRSSNIDCLYVFDYWILTKWCLTKHIVNCNIKIFRFDLIVFTLCSFITDYLSGVYLEVIKYRMIVYTSNKFLSLTVFFYVFLDFLKTIHPITPCITSEIWCFLYQFYSKDKFVNIVDHIVPVLPINEFDCCIESDIVVLILGFIKTIRTYVVKNNIVDVILYIVKVCKNSLVLYKYKGIIEFLSGIRLLFICAGDVKNNYTLLYLFGVSCYIAHNIPHSGIDHVILGCDKTADRIDFINLSQEFFKNNLTESSIFVYSSKSMFLRLGFAIKEYST